VIAQISDPHLEIGPRDRDSADALAAAVAAIGRVRPAPEAVLLTGDLANHAEPREYSRVRELLAPLTVPVHPIPGNLDDRDALRAAFSDHEQVGATTDYMQYAVRCGDVRVVLCDTLEPGQHGGRLGPERLAWLEAELEREPATPKLLALHHPPILTGLPNYDSIGLPVEDRRALADLVGRTGTVRLVATGHVHRAICGTLAGRPVFVCPSAHLQARLDFEPSARIELAEARPAFALHTFGQEGPVTHLEPIESPAGAGVS
jgi:Icc protein